MMRAAGAVDDRQFTPTIFLVKGFLRTYAVDTPTIV